MCVATYDYVFTRAVCGVVESRRKRIYIFDARWNEGKCKIVFFLCSTYTVLRQVRAESALVERKVGIVLNAG